MKPMSEPSLPSFVGTVALAVTCSDAKKLNVAIKTIYAAMTAGVLSSTLFIRAVDATRLTAVFRTPFADFAEWASVLEDVCVDDDSIVVTYGFDVGHSNPEINDCVIGFALSDLTASDLFNDY